ncbi:MAG: hypothetical protein IIA61_01195 [Candidatus Marinimicrobia bacterium]|nr:hypothetical protein [Candidatus Neomarinimicrobiota bacterium]
MTLSEFQQHALTEFTREITDLFFCYIEDDKDLMQEYLRVIGRDSNLDTTNRNLGLAVKTWFNLEDGIVNKEPMSKLIRSYTEHQRS